MKSNKRKTRQPFAFFVKHKKLLISLGVVIGTLYLFLVWIFGPLPNVDLWRFSNNFNAIPLPSKTYQVGKLHKEFGLMGNGNHCDYFVSKMIVSELTLDELQAYFREKTIPLVDYQKKVMHLRYLLREHVVEDLYKTTFADVVSLNEILQSPLQSSIRATEVFEEHEVDKDQVNPSVTYVISVFDPEYPADYWVCH